jgi:hypothetical protein
MSIDHLAGKRTGRPRGSKSTLSLKRDLLWVARHLGKEGAQPPTDGAKFWLMVARERPDKFILAITAMEAASQLAVCGPPIDFVGQPVKAIHLDHQQVLRALRTCRPYMPDYGIEVVGVCFAIAPRGVVVIVKHSSFARLEEGQNIPEIPRPY